MTSDQSNESSLSPCLVPQPLVRQSVYRSLRRNRLWRRIREDTRETAQGKCQICGVERARSMICHEDWEYDDNTHVALLRRFMWICPDCNGVMHIAGSGVSWSGDLLNDPALKIFDHMAKVTGLPFEKLLQIFAEANREYDERSTHAWTLDISQSVLEKYPELADLNICGRCYEPHFAT